MGCLPIAMVSHSKACRVLYRLVLMIAWGCLLSAALHGGEDKPGNVDQLFEEKDPKKAEPKVAEQPNQQIAKYNRGRIFADQAPRQEGDRTGTETSVSGFGFYLVLYLFLLIGFLWGGLYLVKRYLPGGRQLFSSPAMEILGRTHVDPKNYLAMVRVGTRLLVVGVGPDGMRTLCEIGDESEVTEMLGQAQPKSEAGMSLFQRLFKANMEKTQEVKHEDR